MITNTQDIHSFRWRDVIAVGLALVAACWTICAVVLVRFLGDRWWLGTIALFSPRWMLMLPLALGVCALPWLSKYYRLLVIGSILTMVWGVSGLCIPYEGWLARPNEVIRVLTCNVAKFRHGTDQLSNLISSSAADIVMLQEYDERTGLTFPNDWYVEQAESLLIASRFPLQKDSYLSRNATGTPGRPIMFSAECLAGQRKLQLVTLHLPSPHYGLDELIDSKSLVNLTRRERLIRETKIREIASRRAATIVERTKEPLIVGGDYNMPVESCIFRSDWGHLTDAFSATGFGVGNTCFVKKKNFSFGARVDHFLSGEVCRPLRCWVGPDIGSDHLPVIADFYWE